MNGDNSDELYNKVGYLLNLYKYTKKNINIEPFIIINKL